MNAINQIKMFELENKVEVLNRNYNNKKLIVPTDLKFFEKVTDNSSISQNDCLKGLTTIASKSIDFILTDPPYNLGNFMHNRNTNLVKMRANQFAYSGWDNLEFDEWKENMDIFFKESNRVLKKKGSMILFMSLIKLETMIELAAKNGFYYKTVGIWHKKNPMPRNMNLHFINSTEAWIYFINEGTTGVFNNKGKVIHDFIESGLTNGSEKSFGKHPTQKPLKVLNHFIELLSNEKDTILDPFMGSGSTGVSCEILNRKFLGIEIDEKYFKIAKNRILKGY